MLRVAVIASLFIVTVLACGNAVGQDKKVDPLDEPILGKTLGEWLKILRTHKNAKFRRAALIALEGSNTANKIGLPALLECIEKDDEPQVRMEAVLVLGRQGPETKGAIRALVIAAHSDKSERVREAAATAISINKFIKQAEDYIPLLLDILNKDPHAGTRVAVAGILRDMGAGAKPAFSSLLEAAKKANEDPLVRAAALHVVSRHDKDNPKVISLMIDFLKDAKTPPALREASAEGLGRSASSATDVIGILETTLIDRKQTIELRKTAANSLLALKGNARAAWPAVKKLVTDPSEDGGIRNSLIRLTGVFAFSNTEAIEALTTAAASDLSTENRIAAIQELGELPSLPASTRKTLKDIADEDARAAIREAAAKVLKKS